MEDDSTDGLGIQVTYLNSVVMPDDPASSSSSGAEDNVEADEGSESDVEEMLDHLLMLLTR